MKLVVALIAGLCLLGPRPAWAAEADSRKAKESYLKKADADIQDWTAKLKSLQERSEKSGANSRHELDRQIKHLHENLEGLRKNIEDLRTSKAGTWKNLRNGLEEALRDVKKAFGAAQSFFDKTETKGTP